jgi:hypothetical protein
MPCLLPISLLLLPLGKPKKGLSTQRFPFRRKKACGEELESTRRGLDVLSGACLLVLE